jgi:hypothetical protein
VSASIVQWVIVIGVAVICFTLFSIADQLKSLNQKVEYWGKMLSDTTDEMKTSLTEMMADTSSLHHDVSDLAKRAAERLPTTKEIEHARRNEL